MTVTGFSIENLMGSILFVSVYWSLVGGRLQCMILDAGFSILDDTLTVPYIQIIEYQVSSIEYNA